MPGIAALNPSATVTKPLRSSLPVEHATVNVGAIASDRAVADSQSFLSALVLAQPSPRAVIGSG